MYPAGTERRLAQRLALRGVLAWNPYLCRGRGDYAITKLGKIPVGALSLLLFNQVQEPVLHQKHAALEQRARERSAAIVAGMEQARQQSIHVGRPPGGEPVEVFLAKETSQRVVAVLRDVPGLSIRQAAQVAGVAINTVRKVAAAVGHLFA